MLEEFWIDVVEKLPEDDSYILLSFANYDVPCVGMYIEDEEGGAFYTSIGDVPLVSIGIIVNAWMPLPKCYEC